MKRLAIAVLLPPLVALAEGAPPPPPAAPPPPAPPEAAAPAATAAKPAAPPASQPVAVKVDPGKDLRANLRQRKTELMAKNLPLTAEQAAAFWPVYKRYDDELAKLHDEIGALVREYLAVYERLDDATAKSLQDRTFAQQEKALQLRRTAADEVGKVLPAKLTAKFVQLDRYYALLTEVQVASKIPQIQ